MKKNLLFVLIPSLLLMSCTTTIDDDEHSSSSHSITTSQTSSSTSSNNGTTSDSSTSGSEDTNSTNNSTNTDTNTTSSNSASNTADTNTSIITGATNDEDEWKQGRQLLDCGYYAMGLPKNTTPISLPTSYNNDSTQWHTGEMYDSMPSNYRYIYKNACDDGPSGHRASPNFYAHDSSKPGGLKVSMPGIGFETLLFSHSGEKLEIRIGITQVNNANDSVTKGDVAHIYFFNDSGAYLGKYVFGEGSIVTSTAGSYLKCYWTNNASDVAYFEFRCNQKPFKGSQVYNFGIGYCSIKSWPTA